MDAPNRWLISTQVLAALDERRHAPDAWDKQFLRSQILESYEACLLDGGGEDGAGGRRGLECCLRHYEYKAVFPTKARDSVVVLGVVADGAGNAARCVASVVAPDVAGARELAHYVRMDVDYAGYYLEAVDARTTRLTSVVVLDPKGFIPTPVVNFVAFDRPMGMARLKKTAAVVDEALWPPARAPPPSANDDGAAETASSSNSALVEAAREAFRTFLAEAACS